MTYPILADLLSRLRADGFEIGVGSHLRVQELLSRLPERYTEEELGSFLCPLFAKNAADQERFQELYQESLNAYRLTHSEEKSKIKDKTKKRKWWQFLAIGSLLGLMGLLIWAIYFSSPEPCPKDLYPEGPIEINLYAGDSTQQYCEFAIEGEDSPIIIDSLWYVGDDSLIRPSVKISLDTCLLISIPDSLSALLLSDSIQQAAYPVQGNRRFTLDRYLGATRGVLFSYKALVREDICEDTLNIELRLQKPSIIDVSDSPEEELPTRQEEIASLDTVPLPYPWGLAHLALAEDQLERQAFIDEHFWWIKLLSIGLLLLALWAFIRHRRQKRQEVIADLESRDHPPFVWDIPFEETPRIILSEGTQKLIRQFRRRGLGEIELVDMGQTVNATVRNAGRLTLRHRAMAQSTDYLLLINRLTRRDHRAQFYNFIFEQLKLQEVHIERFYYKGDPRLCWNEAHPRGLSIQELAQRYGHHRLVVLSSGAEFFNPLTGRLARWSKILETWPQRLLLSPKAWKSWRRKEMRLGERIPVIPASADGLHLLVESWNNREELSGDWASQVGDALEEEVNLKLSAQEMLDHYISPELHDWVRACAIFPSLQWELTLFLGQQLTDIQSIQLKGKELLTTENLQQISRLPWFAQGKMPEEVREELLAQLHDYSELELRVRLQELFTSLDAPPGNSGAFEDRALALVVNEMHLNISPERRKELKDELASFLAAGAEADWVVLKALEKPRDGIDYTLPKHFRKLAEQGKKEVDSRSRLRQNLALGMLGALLLAILMPWNPQLISCEGDRVEFEGQQLCLNTAEDTMVYYQHVGATALKGFDYTRADSLFNWVLSNRNDSLLNLPDSSIFQFRANSAFLYYNASVNYLIDRNGGAVPQSYLPVIHEELSQSQQDTFCIHLKEKIFQYGLQDSILVYPDWLLLDSETNNWCKTPRNNLINSVNQTIDDLFENRTGDTISPVCAEILQEADRIMKSPKPAAVLILKLMDRARGSCPSSESDVQEILQGYYEALSNNVVPDTSRLNPLVVEPLEQGPDTISTSPASTQEVSQNTMDLIGTLIIPESVNPGDIKFYINGQEVPLASSPGAEKLSFSQKLLFRPLQGETTISLLVQGTGIQSLSREVEIPRLNSKRFTLPDLVLEASSGTQPESSPIVPEMVAVAGGSFLMGSPEDEPDRGKSETLHRVRLSTYEIGRYEVTNAEYVRFLNAHYDSDSLSIWINLDRHDYVITNVGEPYRIEEGYEEYPVKYVSWYGARAYCRWLNERQVGGKTGWQLPTEAQWEYAAAGGAKGYDEQGRRKHIYAGTSNPDSLEFYAWYTQNAKSERRVGGKGQNLQGLHDMSGNVWEWCSYWYEDYPIDKGELVNPIGGIDGELRVLRGGSWGNYPSYCRVSFRAWYYPYIRISDVGFRLARSFP